MLSQNTTISKQQHGEWGDQALIIKSAHLALAHPVVSTVISVSFESASHWTSQRQIRFYLESASKESASNP